MSKKFVIMVLTDYHFLPIIILRFFCDIINGIRLTREIKDELKALADRPMDASESDKEVTE